MPYSRSDVAKAVQRLLQGPGETVWLLEKTDDGDRSVRATLTVVGLPNAPNDEFFRRSQRVLAALVRHAVKKQTQQKG